MFTLILNISQYSCLRCSMSLFQTRLLVLWPITEHCVNFSVPVCTQWWCENTWSLFLEVKKTAGSAAWTTLFFLCRRRAAFEGRSVVIMGVLNIELSPTWMRNYTISVTFHWARCGLFVIQLSFIYYFDICEIVDKNIWLVIFKIHDLRTVLKPVMYPGNEASSFFSWFSSFSSSGAKAPHELRLPYCCPHWSWSCDFRLQFLKPLIFRFSSPESSHLTAGQPSLLLPSGL